MASVTRRFAHNGRANWLIDIQQRDRLCGRGNQLAQRVRDLALFNLAIDSKLRGCDLVRIRVSDVAHGARVLPRAASRATVRCQLKRNYEGPLFGP